MGCKGDRACRAKVDAAFEHSVCLCGWTVNWNAAGTGYGMSWSSENTPATCGGQEGPASAETAGSGSEADAEPEPESVSEEADEEDASAGNSATSTTANSGDIACTDAPALDWTGIDPSANGEAGVSEECRNRNFQQRQLDAHNDYRARHGADDLLYDPELAAAAQAYAEHLADIDQMRHDPELRTLKQGENLAWQWSSVPNYAATANIYGTKGVDDWYAEVHEFDYFNQFDKN